MQESYSVANSVSCCVARKIRGSGAKSWLLCIIGCVAVSPSAITGRYLTACRFVFSSPLFKSSDPGAACCALTRSLDVGRYAIRTRPQLVDQQSPREIAEQADGMGKTEACAPRDEVLAHGPAEFELMGPTPSVEKDVLRISPPRGVIVHPRRGHASAELGTVNGALRQQPVTRCNAPQDCFLASARKQETGRNAVGDLRDPLVEVRDTRLHADRHAGLVDFHHIV